MTQFSDIQSSDIMDFLDAEALTDEQIELSPEQMQQAAQLSQSVANSSDSWQLYLHALALAGFKQWLEEWSAELEIDDSRCAIAQPDPPLAAAWNDRAPMPASLRGRFIAVHHLFVAKFHLCLIAPSLLLDSTIRLPKAIVDSRQFTPHMYVLIEVQEEQMQVKVCGYLRRDHLFEQQRSHPLRTVPSEMYAVPIDWFNLDPTALLLELSCLKPYSLDFLPQPQIINVRHWLSDRLDDLAAELGWRLMPLTPAAAMRSAQEDLLTLGVPIPPEARGIYQEFQLDAGNAVVGSASAEAQTGAVTARLQAVTWVLSASVDAFEWTLLITLSGDRLPIGTRLAIRDDSQLLFEQTVESAEATALYGQVGGDLSDQFWVTIDRPDGSTINLPPFCFDPDFAA